MSTTRKLISRLLPLLFFSIQVGSLINSAEWTEFFPKPMSGWFRCVTSVSLYVNFVRCSRMIMSTYYPLLPSTFFTLVLATIRSKTRGSSCGLCRFQLDSLNIIIRQSGQGGGCQALGTLYTVSGLCGINLWGLLTQSYQLLHQWTHLSLYCISIHLLVSVVLFWMLNIAVKLPLIS